ncbi:hypothetical protein ACFQYP_00415 [Nonomuraea antimicrobica]
MDWVLVEVHDDLHVEQQDDRWLLIYEVPTTVAPDGRYSVSYPKGMVNDWAATYGYDLDDPGDVDALFDHLFHLPAMREEARLADRLHEVTANPFEMAAVAARALADDQVRTFTASNCLVEEPRAARAGDSLLARVRADMLARASMLAVRELAGAKDASRVLAQERMVTLALRMNASRDADAGSGSYGGPA